MHGIIGGLKHPFKAGPKLAGLLELDKAGLCPDFFVLPRRFFVEALSGEDCSRGIYRNKKNSPSVRASFRRRIKNWKLPATETFSAIPADWKKIIIRSSFSGEGDSRKSFSGIFPSFVLNSRPDIPGAVRKIWASAFSEKAALYSSSPGEMDIIIQEFAETELKGHAIFSFGKERNIYAEYYSSGSGKKKIFIEKNGLSFFNADGVEEEAGWRLLSLGEKLEQVGKPFGKKNLLVEFGVSAGRLLVFQLGGRNFWPEEENIPVKFENEAHYNYHSSDFSVKEFNRLLAALGLSAGIKAANLADGVFIRFGLFKKLEKELKLKVSRETVSKFNSIFLEFLRGEAVSASEPARVPDLFMKIKSANFRLAVFNYLYTRLVNFSLEKLSSGMEENLFRVCARKFLSPARSALFRLREDFRVSMPEKKKELGADAAARLGRLLARSFRAVETKKTEKAGREKLLFFEALGRAVEIKNSVNSRFFAVNSARAALIAARDTRFRDRDIQALCRLSLSDILKGKAAPEKPASPKPAVASFPLKGTAVFRGRLSGRVVKAFPGMPSAGLDEKSVLVGEYLDSSLIYPMLLCGGMVAGRGGLLSHAAVIAGELRKPCVVDVRGCAEILKGGEPVLIDGDKIYRGKK